jgi:hypothetical protein
MYGAEMAITIKLIITITDIIVITRFNCFQNRAFLADGGKLLGTHEPIHQSGVQHHPSTKNIIPRELESF